MLHEEKTLHVQHGSAMLRHGSFWDSLFIHLKLYYRSLLLFFQDKRMSLDNKDVPHFINQGVCEFFKKIQAWGAQSWHKMFSECTTINCVLFQQKVSRPSHFRVECTNKCGWTSENCRNRIVQVCSQNHKICSLNSLKRGRQHVLVIFRDVKKEWTLRCVSEFKSKEFVMEYVGRVSHHSKQ